MQKSEPGPSPVAPAQSGFEPGERAREPRAIQPETTASAEKMCFRRTNPRNSASEPGWDHTKKAGKNACLTVPQPVGLRRNAI
jgi:hypothetical protein